MRLSARPARSPRMRAVLSEPVKLMTRTAGLSKKTSAIAAAPSGALVTTLKVPGGKPASARISACTSPDEMGASSDGLMTVVLPNAIGSRNVRQAR